MPNKQLFSHIQFSLLVLLILTLPYSIAPSFALLLSFLLFIITFIINKIVIQNIVAEKTFLLLFTFILLIYCSTLWSPANDIFGGNFKVSVYGYLNYFFLIPAIYFSNLAIHKINTLFIFIAISPLIYILLYYTNHFGITNIYSEHYLPSGNHHLYVDIFANIFILFSSVLLYIKSLYYLRNKNYKKTLLFFITFLIVSISLFIDKLTISRGVNLAFMISFGFISLYYLSNKQKLFTSILLSTLFVSYISISKDFQQGIHEIKNVCTSNQFEGSWGHRTKLAEYGLEMWLENPLIGRGTVDIIDKMRANKKNHPEDFKDPTIHFHNQHILILVQIGIFGYLIFLAFIYNLYRFKIQNEEINLYKKTTVLIFLVLMFSEHYLEMVHTSTFFALLIGLFLLYKNQELALKSTSEK